MEKIEILEMCMQQTWNGEAREEFQRSQMRYALSLSQMCYLISE